MAKARRIELCGVVVALCIATAAADAQTPPPPKDDWPYAEIIAREDAFDHFKPSDHGMTAILPDQLFDALIEKGRCPIGVVAKSSEGVPCAFISYATPSTERKDAERSLRPVFRVASRNTIWTVWNGGIAKVGVETLQRVYDLTDPGGRSGTDPYPAVAVVGVSENEKLCKARQPCLDAVRVQQQALSVLTPGCIEEIWNRRGGASGSGHQSRCRYGED